MDLRTFLVPVVVAALLSPTGVLAGTPELLKKYVPFARTGEETALQTEPQVLDVDGLPKDMVFKQFDVVGDAVVLVHGSSKYKLLLIDDPTTSDTTTSDTTDDSKDSSTNDGVVSSSVKDPVDLLGVGRRSNGLAAVDDGRDGTARVDLRSRLTPVRWQGERSTCTVFAIVAALEFEDIARGGSAKTDYSEQHGYWNACQFIGREQGVDGALWPDATAMALSRHPVCDEVDWPYTPATTPSTAPVAVLRRSDLHGPGVVTRIPTDVDRPAARATVRHWLYRGHVVVSLFCVAWDDEAANTSGRIDVVRGSNGKHPKSGVGHTMLVCGYDDGARYFIVKNSWGEEWGDRGYGYLSYDYFDIYAYGQFIVFGEDLSSAGATNVRKSS